MRQARKLMTGVIVAVATAGGALVGAGEAAAVPDVVDRPYKDAKRMIERSGGKAVVATRVGTGAEEAACLVTNAWDAAVRRPNSRSRLVVNREVMVALNCNGVLAAPGSPGNSALSPTGRQAKAEAEEKARKAELRRQAAAAAAAAPSS